MVITGRSRKPLCLLAPWVRIPPPPMKEKDKRQEGIRSPSEAKGREQEILLGEEGTRATFRALENPTDLPPTIST